MNPADRALFTHCCLHPIGSVYQPYSPFIEPDACGKRTSFADATSRRLLDGIYTGMFLLANNKLVKRGKLLHQHQENRDLALLLHIKVISGGK